MGRIEAKNDVTRGIEEIESSDSRLNVDARVSGHGYFISRDEGQCYSMSWDFQTSASGEFAAYVKNTNPNKTLVVQSFSLNAVVATKVKIHFVTGTAAGTAVIPVNLNRGSSNDAQATCAEAAGAATGITGLTSDGVFGHVYVGPYAHVAPQAADQVRLGEGDAIAIEVDETAGGDFSGAVFFYYE